MKIKIKNYQIIEDLELETNGITIISGRNNNGKSSFMRAIRAVCFGQSGNQFITNGKKNCEVEISFEDKIFKWVKGNDEKGLFYIDEEKHDSNGKPPEKYFELLNIIPLDISKTTYRPNFSFQFEPLFLIYSGPTECANALSFLFSGNKFPSLLKDLNLEVRGMNKEIVYLEGSIDQKEKEIQSTKETINEFARYDKWIERKDEIITHIDVVEELDSNLMEIEKANVDLLEFQKKYSDTKKRYFKHKNIDEFLVTELEVLNSTLISYLKAEKELIDVKENKVQAQDELDKYKRNLSCIVDEIQRCPFCGNSIDEEKKISLLD